MDSQEDAEHSLQDVDGGNRRHKRIRIESEKNEEDITEVSVPGIILSIVVTCCLISPSLVTGVFAGNSGDVVHHAIHDAEASSSSSRRYADIGLGPNPLKRRQISDSHSGVEQASQCKVRLGDDWYEILH